MLQQYEKGSLKNISIKGKFWLNEITEENIDRACSLHESEILLRNMYKYWPLKLKIRGILGDNGVGERIILKRILNTESEFGRVPVF